MLAETLTQVSPQMASHAGLNTAQAGGMTKVSELQCCECILLVGGRSFFLPNKWYSAMGLWGTILSSFTLPSCPLDLEEGALVF